LPNGYFSDIRIYKGVAKYTSNFNPPSSTQNATVAAGNDSLVDSPTNGSQVDTGVGGEVVGNYATLNALANGATLSNGNLDITGPASGYYGGSISTIALDSGKYYWEYTVTNNYVQAAICGISARTVAPFSSLSSADEVYYQNNYVVTNGSTTSGLNTIVAGDVIGITWDGSSNQIKFYRNNSLQTTVTASSGKTYFAGFGGIVNNTASINFGQRPFAYTAPSGFKALCTTNLPEPTIADGSTAMDVALYTGNGSTQTISGLNFSPDLVWIKTRSAVEHHVLVDAVRGTSKNLFSSTTSAEETSNPYGSVTAFNSDGFAVGGGSIDQSRVNGNSVTHAAWTWDAGSSTVTNTEGSITSSVRASASSGFSVITYSGNGVGGASVGHNLGVAPGFFVCKRRSGTGNWYAYHSALGGNYAIDLNGTAAASSNAAYWNNTNPSSTVITLSSTASVEINGSGDTYVIYAWAPVAGYSSAFSYTGNGDSSGPFVYLGFRPKWLLVKETTNSNSWFLLDATRSPYNYAGDTLWPNLSNQENDTSINPNTTYNNFDFLSNGFKPRSAYSGTNRSGGTYIGFAFAENPFQYARAR
jgi:hypothetical protein